ncbi:MAG: SPOR domain-containing protein [Thiobacillus sp.]|nr:SPOR domain-containing protein [Thiobacillus sp.]
MPLPSNENDLKRRARRRLIGAVALTLLAVIALPLLLEDEPPPASVLAVRMATKPTPSPTPTVAPTRQNEPLEVAEPLVLSQPVEQPAPTPAHKPEPQPAPAPAPKPVTVKPETPKPNPKPASVKPVETPEPPTKSAAVSNVFVVQLAALSDASKAEKLKSRAASAGLPAFTDKVGNLTRVRVGPYPTRAAAVAAAVKLAENNMAGQVLTQ